MMIKYLRLFHFDPSEDVVIITPGEIFNSIDLQLSTFFWDHASKSLKDTNTQNFRFKNKDVEFVAHLQACFLDVDSFDSSSVKIADKMKNSLSKNSKNDFYLVIFTNVVEEKPHEDILCILKMDSMDGIHVGDSLTLDYFSQMLPDKKSRLQKASFVYKTKVEDFVNNLEPDNQERLYIHSKILDRQDPSISGLFLDHFMDSFVVTDKPESIGKLAVNSVVAASKKYLSPTGAFGVSDIKELLKNELSVEKQTSFDALADIIYGKLDPSLLAGKTSENLATEAYDLAYKENPTVVRSFSGRFRKPPKVQLIDSTNKGKINISYLKSLEQSGEVQLDSSSDNEFHILKVKKNIVIKK